MLRTIETLNFDDFDDQHPLGGAAKEYDDHIDTDLHNPEAQAPYSGPQDGSPMGAEE